MDDLTKLKGIGTVTAKRLAAAGIDSFARLAAANPAQLEAAKINGSSKELEAMIAAAAVQLEPQERAMSDDELRALVAAWDEARAELNAAGDAVADLQAQLAALAPDADRTELDAGLAAAQERVGKAHAAIEALRPLPSGVRLPNAKPVAKRERLPQAAAAAGERMAVTVIGPAKGRRRAGFDFNASPRTVFVTPGELALIEADPSLGLTMGELASGLLADPASAARLTIADFAFGEDATALVKVLGPAKGRRRAGFAFDSQAQTIAVTVDQLTLLLGDEQLAVSPA
jgi:hypothetical protein